MRDFMQAGRPRNSSVPGELIAELHGGELPAVNCQAIECTDDDQQAEARRGGCSSVRARTATTIRPPAVVAIDTWIRMANIETAKRRCESCRTWWR